VFTPAKTGNGRPTYAFRGGALLRGRNPGTQHNCYQLAESMLE